MLCTVVLPSSQSGALGSVKGQGKPVLVVKGWVTASTEGMTQLNRIPACVRREMTGIYIVLNNGEEQTMVTHIFLEYKS